MLSKIFTTVALAASLVSAQTFTECDPTKRDGCPNPKAVGSKVVDIDFRKGANSFFKPADGTTLKYDDNLGAIFSISNEKNAPTIGSKKYIFFGQVDVTVRAARGVGVVTSFVLQSDDLDEIDWEWLGGDATQVQTNFFSKGCTDTYDRGGFSPVADPVNQFHTYTIKWTPEQLDWIIDGAVGTIDWAGGITDFTDAPFDGYYQSLRIQDYMGGKGAKEATEYHYTDRSGTWQSIKVVNNGEEAEDNISTSSTSKATSTTKKPTSSATTLATVSSSASLTSANGTVTQTTASPTQTTGDDEQSATTAASETMSTGAAPSMAGNMAAVGAAALFGYLVL
ncbi:hypothetical protein CHGG_09093 [Chaetomium globosum CBS 148.51]|uniref:GH16 domain-containing protein n=1 Tax=Chaetomium globosum (strain ATCC 6205 / CBS 148.51 / DSM 1962 / NBRC 6347 / NRRL 1970) TaxID=306901 RepID=Q2GSG1_CHAGB|nr:uncharacterized protein CHGG_09093 [Chaetomium globosum CBS 148.51]EAQ85079.1 hypothetical protein CHGG_09093 [Chaetomium globosum CBS 148.51]